MNNRITYKWKWTGAKNWIGLAINCHLWYGYDGTELRFYDTNRGHCVHGKIAADGNDTFTFQSDGAFPGIWTFEKLTIEDVRRGIVRIENGGVLNQVIRNTDDLQEWYRKTFGEDAGLNYPDVTKE